jgi:phosphatidylserine/phosphatidylglycerophosphate/cardiolipin synthase-like enzyme
LTLDGEVTLIGSANMDRRSFELNYENNILFFDPALTAEMRCRQDPIPALYQMQPCEVVRKLQRCEGAHTCTAEVDGMVNRISN